MKPGPCTSSCLLMIACAMAVGASAQDPMTRLRAELEHIHDLDQEPRHAVSGFIGAQKDSVIAVMTLNDSTNLIRVMAIIDSAGWLGPQDVGGKASQALFLVLQHADAKPEIQQEYLPTMREAAAEGKARPDELALFEDRVAVNHGKPQIYGSQVDWKDGKPSFKPIEDEEHVNERRKAVGLEPLENYAARFGFGWSPPEHKERVLLMGPGKQ
jgi:hypothetical protein